MKHLFLVLLSLSIVLNSCDTTREEISLPSELELQLNEFMKTEVYADLKSMGLSFDFEKSFLGENTQFDLLFLKEDLKSNEQSYYAIRRISSGIWKHFMNIRTTGNFNTGRPDGTLILNYYPNDVYSVHNFSEGVQMEFQVYAEDQPRRIFSGRTSGTEECESACHVLDCAGRKFNDKHWLSKINCASNIIGCIASLSMICLDEGCENSFVRTCDHH